MDITKKELLEHFGGIRETSVFFGITYEAVRQWKEVPLLKLYQLRENSRKDYNAIIRKRGK